MNFEPLIKFGVDQGASAIHLQAGASPQLRIGGLIRNVESPAIKADELTSFIKSIAPEKVATNLEGALTTGSTFTGSLPSAGRFRCTVVNQVGGPAAVLRVISAKIRGVEELHLPAAVRQVALTPQGLVLVAGPSVSGKTTTLAAMVDAINGASYRKIVTVEAPVEYLHATKKSLITQTEVGSSSSTCEQLFEIALQQDADVIVLSEIREPAVALMALAAAESGKKILASMTAPTSIQTIARLLAMIPPVAKETAVYQLAAALEAVVVQRLAKTRDGQVRPAVEFLRGGAFTSVSILENRLKDLTYYMQGRQNGMQSLDQHLIELHQSGEISGTEAMRLASDPEAVGEGLRAPRRTQASQSAGLAQVDDADPGLLP